MNFSFKKTVFIFLAGFLGFFLLRLGFGYLLYPEGEVIGRYNPMNTQSDFAEYKARNIARQKTKQVSTSPSAAPLSVDQRYEKVANMSMVSEEFEEDSKSLRETIKQYKALVQFEQSNGLAGSRSIQLALGVNPANFDQIIDDLKKLAKLKSLQVNKTDKTNEYKTLQATQLSLTKSRDALLALKSREAKVAEMIGLEERILEIEQRIQDLGVNLGDFDSENEFVTVKLTLYEVAKSSVRHVSIINRSFTAFVFAVKYYGIFVLTFLMFLIGTLAAAKILEIGLRIKNKPAGA
ncbi:MAG: DUF4349 domain-containing protein [Rhizobiaceae bacterium]